MSKIIIKIHFCLLIALQALITCEARSRKLVFESTSNYDDNGRWSDGKLPCSEDIISFDKDLVVSVFVQTNATINEIILPMDGEFLFGNNVIWGSSKELSGCSSTSAGRTAKFDSSPDNWFDGDKWGVYDGNKDMSLDVLDTEKVPCDFDDIQFPASNSWTLAIPFDSESASLTIWEKSYSRNEFATYRTTGSGRYQFQGTGSLTSIGGRCNDVTGCLCRSSTNSQIIDTAICDLAICSNELCQNPLSPQGQCCPTCGALLTMGYSSRYTENKMIQQIDRLRDSNSQFPGIHYALSKIKPYSATKSPFIQILVRDEETGTQRGSVAKQFSTELSYILTTTEDLGVSNVTISTSGDGLAPQGSFSGGEIAGIVIGVICAIMLLSAVAMYVSKRYSFRGFSHKKFVNHPENFDNPLYDIGHGVESIEKPMIKDSAGQTSSITGIPQQSVLSSDFGISFGNPLYQDEDV